MEPSRELDAKIAEKVLKLEVVRNKKGGWSIGEANWYDEAGEMKMFNPLPSYSTDIVSAMEVFEHLRNSNKWCCLKIHSDYNYRWDVSLTPAEDITDSTYSHKPTVYVSDESLPLAICLAALKTVENES